MLPRLSQKSARHLIAASAYGIAPHPPGFNGSTGRNCLLKNDSMRSWSWSIPVSSACRSDPVAYSGDRELRLSITSREEKCGTRRTRHASDFSSDIVAATFARLSLRFRAWLLWQSVFFPVNHRPVGIPSPCPSISLKVGTFPTAIPSHPIPCSPPTSPRPHRFLLSKAQSAAYIDTLPTLIKEGNLSGIAGAICRVQPS